MALEITKPGFGGKDLNYWKIARAETYYVDSWTVDNNQLFRFFIQGYEDKAQRTLTSSSEEWRSAHNVEIHQYTVTIKDKLLHASSNSRKDGRNT